MVVARLRALTRLYHYKARVFIESRNSTDFIFRKTMLKAKEK